MEKLLVESWNGKLIQPSEEFQTMYGGELPLDRLVVQLSMLPDLLRTASEQHHMGIQKVTRIDTVCQIFNACFFAKTKMGDVDGLLRIYLTVPMPMTSATAERSFPALCLRSLGIQ